MVTSSNETGDGDAPPFNIDEYYKRQRQEYHRTRDLYFPRKGFERLPMFLQVILGMAGAVALVFVAGVVLAALSVGLPIVLKGG